MKKRIINSLLDLDFYKLTMLQVVWKYFRDVKVKYAFKNRTKKVALANFIKEEDLRAELEHARGLHFKSDEIKYLRTSIHTKDIFSDDFLDFLKDLRLCDFQIENDGANYKIEVEGSWPEAILWETMILGIVNELYYRFLIRDGKYNLMNVFGEGDKRLNQKAGLLKEYPRIRFSDFGTRRRFSGLWQRHVVERLAKELPEQFMGTSNVLLAKELGLRPIGTFAHEMYMIFSGIFSASDEEIKSSHNKALQIWWNEYGEKLSIALTDTYGTKFFFDDFTDEQIRLWKGLRQDSGDPFEFGENAVAFYESKGIDPWTKVIVFSDGLDVETIVALYERFAGRIQVMFGWGTNLCNDLGFEALSLVVKAVKANGFSLVKLSDNLAKATGEPEQVERFKKIFVYTKDFFEECRY